MIFICIELSKTVNSFVAIRLLLEIKKEGLVFKIFALEIGVRKIYF